MVVAPPGPAEPWTQVGEVGAGEVTVLGIDVGPDRKPGPVVLGREAALFPWRSLSELPAGRYKVQAMGMTNRDLWMPQAPGNWLGEAREIHLDPRQADPVRISLTGALPAEVLPPEAGLTRYRKYRSARLSAFWGRDIFLRVGVVLPRTFATEPTRRYPVVVQIGGYGERYDRIGKWFRDGASFGREWLASDTPQMVVLALDGAGPLGDPYQVDSDNHGPYGAALMEEVLPEVEREFRGRSEPQAHFTTGGSTGGWVSLALQVFYPERFGGCWSGYPDPVDFRDYELINIYGDTNALADAKGRERAAARLPSGKVDFTVRHELQHENVLGLGDSYIRGGGQWGAWNATFGPRSATGLPVPLWDARTGRIDPEVAAAWRRYDLVPLLAAHWPTLGPKLRGKLHVWVGERDEYFLNNAVHRLDDFLRGAQPPAQARIWFDPQAGHGWEPLGWAGRLKEMQAVVDGK